MKNYKKTKKQEKTQFNFHIGSMSLCGGCKCDQFHLRFTLFIFLTLIQRSCAFPRFVSIGMCDYRLAQDLKLTCFLTTNLPFQNLTSVKKLQNMLPIKLFRLVFCLFRFNRNIETLWFGIEAKQPKQTFSFGQCRNQFRFQFRLFRIETSFEGHPTCT